GLPGLRGLGGPLAWSSQARCVIVWRALGAARTCYLTALGYAQDRRQFGRPIARYQLVQQKLVHMLTGITTGQLLAWRLGRLKDARALPPEPVSPATRPNVSPAAETAPPARAPLRADGGSNRGPRSRHTPGPQTR